MKRDRNDSAEVRSLTGNSRLRATVGISDFLWAMYAWCVFGICVSAAILGALLLPGVGRRRRWVSGAGRAIFRLSRADIRIRGLEKIPTEQCVVVANHASYLDGVIMKAYLPPRFGFVIKSEMSRIPLAAFPLRRIGAEFVERFEASGSARDARRLLKVAESGESLVFFPEGTFLDQPGLDRFRAGAFAIAINSRLPVVPVAICGSRDVLPSGTFLPRRGRIQLEILDPIEPSDAAFGGSKDLAELARRRILSVLDEPDLVATTSN